MWAPVAFLVTGSLAATHLYALPTPPDHAALERALAARRGASEHGKFMAVHVLYSECNCSQRIFEHLWRRRARRDIAESLLLVAEPAADTASLSAAARRAGFRVELLAPAALTAHYRIEAAPLLIVTDPNDRLRYLGGYTERKQGPWIEDGIILDRVLAGRDVPALPALGCAISRVLQRTLDPFGLTYLEQRAP